MQRNDDTAMPTLAIHGAGGGAWEWTIWQRVWQAQARPFAALELMPAVDGLAQTRLSDYLAQARTAARAMPRPCLVGASLGGLIALALAAEVDASALVLVDALPPRGVAPRPPLRVMHDDIVAWGSRRRFASTQRALPDADAAAQHYAFRRWRDESAAVLREAVEGLDVAPPRCPVLVIAAELDEAVPIEASRVLAQSLDATFWPLRASHVGPLLGRSAAAIAARALAWTQAVTLSTAP
ncbi:alpha/beta fold hydrolase [Tahibacter sp. UC22_41]|uniref:alpha/beta fold hydrolase n=1 Tax=Tahibacter sp. UC22_41 TaxID=3350178 RepID=UPI0036DDFE60